MTLMRIEIDGEEYPVLHYRFAINQKDADHYKIHEEDNEIFFAIIGGITYVLGYTKADGTKQEVIQRILEKAY